MLSYEGFMKETKVNHGTWIQQHMFNLQEVPEEHHV